jgi:hypothetical protein
MLSFLFFFFFKFSSSFDCLILENLYCQVVACWKTSAESNKKKSIDKESLGSTRWLRKTWKRDPQPVGAAYTLTDSAHATVISRFPYFPFSTRKIDYYSSMKISKPRGKKTPVSRCVCDL